MSDVEKQARWRLVRNAAMIAVAVPATLFAVGCARQEPPPPPPPAVTEAPPPPPAPMPAPAPAVRAYGERG